MNEARPLTEIVGKLIGIERGVAILEIREIKRVEIPKDIECQLLKLKNKTIGLLILPDKIKLRIIRNAENPTTNVNQTPNPR